MQMTRWRDNMATWWSFWWSFVTLDSAISSFESHSSRHTYWASSESPINRGRISLCLDKPWAVELGRRSERRVERPSKASLPSWTSKGRELIFDQQFEAMKQIREYKQNRKDSLKKRWGCVKEKCWLPLWASTLPPWRSWNGGSRVPIRRFRRSRQHMLKE